MNPMKNDIDVLTKVASKVAKELDTDPSKVLPLIMMCVEFDESVVLRGCGNNRMDKAIQIIMEDEDFREMRREVHENEG